jgi:pseudouridine synthase
MKKMLRHPETKPETASSTPQRINRILSLAGLASRRGADNLITAGRVTVNGLQLKAPGGRFRWGHDRICVDGREIPGPTQRIYLMINKPFGYISSLRDPEGRPLVIDLLKDIHQRVYPVGRLDFDTLGLLLLTNDGEWAYRMTHPRYRVPRTYKVELTGGVTEESLSRLRTGVLIDDGTACSAKVSLLNQTQTKSILRMTIAQGKSRQIRRMMDAVGYKVVHLTRISFGHLALGNLKVGEYRHLDVEEIASMKKFLGMT